MKPVIVKQLTLGEGQPKIIVSLMGVDIQGICSEAAYYKESVDFDILELRIDHLKEAGNVAQVVNAVQELGKIIADKPVLFTFRTAKEGGEMAIAAQDYLALNKAVVDTGLVDLIDLELFIEEAPVVKQMVDYAHAKGVKVVMSNHDFAKTPPKDELVRRLRKMQELGADIPKIAVMPQNAQDVLVLLAASSEMHEEYANGPIITMSMGRLGVVSRLAGAVFGSCATFGAAEKASAPGQIDARSLRQILDVLGD